MRTSRLQTLLSISATLILSARLWAQAPDVVRPGVYRAPVPKAPAAVRVLPSLRLPLPYPVEQRFAALSREQMDAFRPKPLLEAAGMHRKLAVETAAAGAWQEANGQRVWRMAVRAEGAQAVRVHFTGFDAGAGRVWVHDGQGGIAGPYSGRGMYGDGDFWSDLIYGESAIVEYEPEDPASDAVPFQATEISHIFRGVETKEGGERHDAALGCHRDASCSPDWADSAKSVALMVFETGEGTATCTGSLIMDRSRTYTPYFLTADHCISDDTEARTLIAVWGYQTPGCNQAAPSLRGLPQSRGARYLAGASMERGDSTLLQLNDVPDGVVFSGWSANEAPLGTKLTGIHHPAGDYKRISFGSRVDQPQGFTANNHYTVQWDSGHTEGGSSGSPVFSEPGVIVGMLSGGLKTPSGQTKCDLSPDYSFYGKFSTAYPELRDYLDGRSVGPDPAGGGNVLGSGASADFSYNVANATLFSGSSSYRVEIPAGATGVEIEVTTNAQDSGVVLYGRYGAAPTVSDGRVQADVNAAVHNGKALLRLDANSSPALRSGTYYFAIAVFATGTDITGRIKATLVSGSAPASTGTAQALTSGTAKNFSIPALTNAALLTGDLGYRIDVPAGATRLDVRVSAPGSEVALLVRYGAAPAIVDGKIQTDYAAAEAGGEQALSITSASSPALKAGTYYIALAAFTTGKTIDGTITATVQTGSGSAGPVALVTGAPQSWSLPKVTGGTLFNGNSGFRVVVPEGATKLEVKVATATAGADVDLFVRFGSDPAVNNGRVDADFSSTQDGGSEIVTITPSSSPALKAGTYYIALALFTKDVAVNGAITATVERASSTPPPQGGTPSALISGVPRSISLPALDQASLFSGAYGYKITVPPGATKLNIRMTTNSGTNVEFYVRYGKEPAIEGSSIAADYGTTDNPGNKSVTIDAGSNPALKAGDYYIAFGVFSVCTQVTGTITATVEIPSATPSDATGTLLASGTPREISIDPVNGGTLFSGNSEYRIVVPEGATKLEIRTSVSPANADIDLYAKFGGVIGISDGRIVADHKSAGPAGDEVITITPTTSPALRAGTYFIALALYTTRTQVKVTLTATVSTGSSGSGSSAPTVLTSGTPRNFTVQPVSKATLLGGSERFQITVPQNASKLTVKLTTATTGADLDLFVRAGQEPEVKDGRVVADYNSSGDGGDESITVTSASSPALKAGTYYISLAMFTTGISANSTITATVETDDTSTATLLTSGTPKNFSFPAQTGPTLMTRSGTYRIVVPDGATRLQVRATASTAGADIDLYVRSGAPPAIENGAVVSDYKSTGTGGDETITVNASSTPPLRPGTYYATILIRTTGTAIGGSITATVETTAPKPAGSTVLVSGTPSKWTLPAADEPTLFMGDYGFRVEVPEGATRLEVKLFTTTPNVDTDLYVRYGADVDLAGGHVVSDYESSGDTGNETIVITRDGAKPLKAGVYYIGMGLFTTGVRVEGTMTATVESAPALSEEPPAGSNSLAAGSPVNFSFDPVSNATLFSGDYAWKLEVPEGTSKVQIDVATETPGADVDLFVRRGSAPEAMEGRVTADYASTSDGGNETVTITPSSNPPLRPGVYYVALGVFTKDTTVKGAITATLVQSQSAAMPLTKGMLRAPSKSFESPAAAEEVHLRVDRFDQGAAVAEKTEFGKGRPVRKLGGDLQ